MKSKRAKEYIQDKDNQLWGVSMGVPLYITFDVEKAVTLAEQDAEERHAKDIQRRGNAVYEVLSRNYGDSIALSLGEEIEAVFNNGGQSDE